MKTHLTEHQLIDFQFELCTDRETAVIAEHLKTCEKCRYVAEQIRQKFGQLDLVKEEVPATEQLITDTLRRVRTTESTKTIYWPRLLGIFGTAAAAALLLAIVAPKIFQTAEQQPMLMASAPESVATIEEKGGDTLGEDTEPAKKNEQQQTPHTELAMAEVSEPAIKGLYAGRMTTQKAAAPMNSVAMMDRTDDDSDGKRFRSKETTSAIMAPKPAAPVKPIRVIMPPKGQKLVSSVYAIESILKDGENRITISNRMPTELTFSITNGTEHIVTIPAHGTTHVILDKGK